MTHKTPQQFGQEAFNRNCPWKPTWDEEFMATLTAENKQQAIEAWQKGWISESRTVLG